MFGIWLVGQVFRDRWWITSLLFYFPSALAALFLLVTAVLAFPARHRIASLAALLCALGPLTVTLFIESRWLRPQGIMAQGESVRLLHWNVMAGGPQSWQKMMRHIVNQSPDLVVLSEASGKVDAKALAKAMGDSDDLLISTLRVVGRGDLTLVERLPIERGKLCSIRWRWKEHDLLILVVDLPSSIRVARAPLLREVMEHVENLQPDLVVGDFNAPTRSLALDDLPDGYAHAFRVAGHGWSGTWPLPIPLWAIDQCITGDGIIPLRYRLLCRPVSDHRMQVLDFCEEKPALAN